jgi:hypothetical protein
MLPDGGHTGLTEFPGSMQEAFWLLLCQTARLAWEGQPRRYPYAKKRYQYGYH